MGVLLTRSVERSRPCEFHTNTVSQISAKNLIFHQFLFSVWACRLHHSLTYSRYLALFIQRSAKIQTGGGGPVHQRRSTAPGPQRVWADFGSWNQSWKYNHLCSCPEFPGRRWDVYFSLFSPFSMGIRWLLIRLLLQIKKRKEIFALLCDDSDALCCQTITNDASLSFAAKQVGWSCLSGTAKPLLIILMWLLLLL